METKKNAEPVTLFSNDTIEIIDNGADYFTKDDLMYGLDGTDFPGDVEDVQRDVIQKLDLEGRAIPDAEGNLTLVGELSPEDFFKKLPSLVPDSYAGMDTVHNAVHEAIWDALYESEYYLNDELEDRHECFASLLDESGLLKKEEPYLMLKGVNPSHIGYKMPSIEDTEDIVSALEGNVDCTTKITRTGNEPYFEAIVSSHDAPTGEYIRIIPQSWFRQAFEDKKLASEIQVTMDYEDDIRDAVYEVIPELYKGKEAPRALRDYTVDELLSASISSPVKEEDAERIAKNVLSFQEEGLKEVCKNDSYHNPLHLDDFTFDFDTCESHMYDYMERLEEGEMKGHPYRQKDLAALTRLFKTCNPQTITKIGDTIEAVAQDKGRMKTLNHLIESQQTEDRAKQTGR